MTNTQLSDQAKTALVNTGTNRQGEVVQASETVRDELALAGLIGIGNGLTRRGTIVRQRLADAALADAFG